MLDKQEAGGDSAATEGRHATVRFRWRERESARLNRFRPQNANSRTRFAAAYADDDVDGVIALLSDDGWVTMYAVSRCVPGTGAALRRLPELGARLTAAAPPAESRTRANGHPDVRCSCPTSMPVSTTSRIIVADPRGRPG